MFSRKTKREIKERQTKEKRNTKTPEKLLFVVSGPSGAGKKHIMDKLELSCRLHLIRSSFHKPVLYYTRERRAEEVDGLDYYYCYGEYLKQGGQRVRRNRRMTAEARRETTYRKGELISTEDPDVLLFSLGVEMQGIDLKDISQPVNFLEIHPTFLDVLKESESFKIRGIKVIRLFISPFTKNEIRKISLESGLTEKEAVKDKLRRGLAARIETGLSGELPAEIEDRVEESALGVLQAMESDGRYDAVLINPYGEADPVWGPALSLPIGGAKDVVENLQRVINAQIETV